MTHLQVQHPETEALRLSGDLPVVAATLTTPVTHLAGSALQIAAERANSSRRFPEPTQALPVQRDLPPVLAPDGWVNICSASTDHSPRFMPLVLTDA